MDTRAILDRTIGIVAIEVTTSAAIILGEGDPELNYGEMVKVAAIEL